MIQKIGVFAAFVLLFGGTLTGMYAGEWHVDGTVAQSGDGKTWGTAFKTVREGIHAASEGDTVIVAEGVYTENVEFAGRNIVLTGTNPADLAVVAATVLDGAQEAPVVSFDGTENETCVLTGLMIQNGRALDGGGVVGGTTIRHTHATIRYNVITANVAVNRGGGLFCCDGLVENNIIVSNTADLGGGATFCDGTIRGNGISLNTAGSGGGLAFCDGSIERNAISRNEADHGGGLHTCDGLIRSNTIKNNSAAEAGGGLFSCNGTLSDNLITENTARFGAGLYSGGTVVSDNTFLANVADQDGGGLSFCLGTIRNNLLIGNSAYSGGAFFQCSGTIRSNLIAGNSSSFRGGGFENCDGDILNNTVVANSARSGGGASRCDGTIRNCIFWRNTALQTGDQLYESSEPAYSCIQDWGGGGDGNIFLNPLFADADGSDGDPETHDDNDYRLASDSPCLDAGDNSALIPAGVDADGNLRIAFGKDSVTVDMGAYEYHAKPFVITEFSFVTLPWPGGRRLVWNSQPNDTYTVWSSYSLRGAEWHEVDTVVSQGESSSCTATGLLPWNRRTLFYRVEME